MPADIKQNDLLLGNEEGQGDPVAVCEDYRMQNGKFTA
jgi:hypothetical protein